MKYKKIAIAAICLIMIWGAIKGVLERDKSKDSGFTATAAANHSGYTLTSKESALLDFLLKDDAAAFTKGENSLLFGDGTSWISAAKVASAYESNQVAADQSYYNKTLFISGRIASINSGLGNEPYVVLFGGNPFLAPQAHFDADNIQELVPLNRGQEIRIVCNGDGAIVGAPIFNKCMFAASYANQKLTGIKKQIDDFLSGEEPQSERIAGMVVVAIAGGRLLPDNSSCVGGGEQCVTEFNAALKNAVSNPIIPSIVKELKADGIQVPEIKMAKSVAVADGTACTEPPKTAELRPPLGYEVAGTERLYFYTAPDDKCIDKNIFVVLGDRLIAYNEYGKWTQVSFSSQSGKTYDGWVTTNRLKFIGTEGNTEQGDLEFYDKAVKAARAGKLGSPWGK
jgi:hypothetical protein